MADEGTSKKGFWAKLIAFVLAVAGAVGVAAKFSTDIRSLVDPWLKKPSVAAVPATPASQQVTAKPTSDQKIPATPAITKPVVQVSRGKDSPNVNDVHGSVHFHANATTEARTATSGAVPVHIVTPSASSVTQISTGDGSPNINNVGGDVDLNTAAGKK